MTDERDVQTGSNTGAIDDEGRHGIALCLSGGGYRATLFDLGAMRRLDELGILSRVRTFSSVSGGSIAAAFVAAHLVDRLGGHWPAVGDRVPEFESGIAEPVRKLAGTNIRTRAALARLNPLNIRNQNAAAEVLAERYAEHISHSAIAQFPRNPGFLFCATDLTFRCGWTVDTRRQLAGNDVSGYLRPADQNWTMARAVAASSCFPGVFPPLRVDVSNASMAGAPSGLTGGRKPKWIDVTDGGVYDNLGLDPVRADHEYILVSDATPSFGPTPDLGPIWPSIRPIVALLEQATIVRKRWLIDGFERGAERGAYWGIASRPSSYGAAPGTLTYSDELIVRYLSQVRIELDEFSPAEMGILENHGYLMCELAIQTHLPELPSIDAPLAPPHPDLMDTKVVERELKSSHKFKVLGRGDWR